MVLKEDTIAAIATAPGEGGIGIIRISGPEAFSILEKVFLPLRKKTIAPDADGNPYLPTGTATALGGRPENRKLTYGHIIEPETGKVIDEVMAVYMKAPYTYTVEDVAEIQCHGSMVSLHNTLALVLGNGARLAEPGEFTKRAFLNGRLDLSQAEAVIDIIKAKTDTGFDSAMAQLSGDVSREVREIRNVLLTLLGDITVNIEYPDEDIEEMTYEHLTESLSQIGDMIEKLLSTAQTGKIIKEGLRVSIVGKPNVGKSSLMNALLRENRAIVTEIPGTTRDTIEEMLNIRGIPICLTDTAGIRDTEDRIEQIGIEKSKASLSVADLIIFVLDGSTPLSPEDYEIMEAVGDKPVLVLINKEDLGIQIDAVRIRAVLPQAQVVMTAVAQGEGMSDIENTIEAFVYGGTVKHGDSVLITNVRHRDLLRKSKSAIGDAINAACAGEPLDIVEIDVKEAYELLGQIIGESVDGDIIDNVFSRFCLGK